MSNAANSTTEEMALALLGDGIAQSVVASHLGVTESAISQWISQDSFKERLVTLRYENLSKHNERDRKLDTAEDTLIEKLTESLPLLFRPMEIARTLQIINAAKRRGSSAPAAMTEQAQVVQLVMPVKIVNKFTVNIMNQVVEAGDQKLVTVQSGVLMDRLKKQQGERERVLLEHSSEGNGDGHGRNEATGSAERSDGTGSAESRRDTASYPVPA